MKNDERIDRRRGYRSASLGVLGVGLLLLLAGSGLLLAPQVRSTPREAHGDVVALAEGASRLGGVRDLHRWTAEAVLVVAFLHLFRVFMAGGYRPPRRGNWVVGVGLLAVLLGEHALGLALPWDQGGAWALAAVLGPGNVGDALSPGLVFALHCLVLPVVLGSLVAWHWRRARRDGETR